VRRQLSKWCLLASLFAGVTARTFLQTPAKSTHRAVTALQFGQVTGESCGVTVSGFGDPADRYVKAALGNVKRFQAMHPGPGWCPLNLSLGHIPITMFTDISPEVISEHLGDLSGMTLVSNTTFEAMTTKKLASGWNEEGPPQFRWYHCQGLMHAPYDITIYLDADATACDARRFTGLVKNFTAHGADIAYQIAMNVETIVGIRNVRGFYCTDGDNTDPHPSELNEQDDEQLSSWQSLEEPNAGVIFYARKSPAAQKVAAGWCQVMDEQMRSNDTPRPCDQYALRAALWQNRHELRPMIIPDAEPGGICRYGTEINMDKDPPMRFLGCEDGCALVHGWRYPEIQALLA